MTSYERAARIVPRYSVEFATSEADVRAAQRLRWQVFAEEGGARIATLEPGLDVDRYDPWCEHLIVRSHPDGDIVGTYRLLTWDRARRLGGFYSDSEFDLTRLAGLRSGMVELGRSCIAQSHRTGAVIALLWSGIAQFLETGGYRSLIGCASISLADGGRAVTGIYHEALRRQPPDPSLTVVPRQPLVLAIDDNGGAVEMPPLVKGYLRSGARVCGLPHYDADFNCADLFMMLDVRALAQRYERRFMRNAARPAA